MFRYSNRKKGHGIAVFVGSLIQKRIIDSFSDQLIKETNSYSWKIISLEDYYRFGVTFSKKTIRLPSLFNKPWYDRRPVLKILSLFQFIWQIVKLSSKYRYFMFFVDTGILERTAIVCVKLLNRRSIVLQDAMKRKPRRKNRKALTWFGGGQADLYLITGSRYAEMIYNRKYKVVGSPVYENRYHEIPIGNKILIVNQCFALYRETTENEEYEFIKDVVIKANKYGPVELRLHPNNNLAKYIGLLSMGIEVTQGKAISCSLQEAGIVLSINSTVILEALSLGRPVLTLDWHPSPYVHLVENVTRRCRNIEEMCVALQEWKINPESLKPKVSDIEKELSQFVKFSGEAAKNLIIKEIYNFIKKDGGERLSG